MKLAIHQSRDSYSDRWTIYCKQQAIDFKLVDCYSNDIVQQLQDCDALLWHHHQGKPRDLVFAKQLLFAWEHAGKKVFPNFKTGWHFDDKLGQKYLLEACNIPMVETFAFFTKSEALSWVEANTFPKVFKLRGGAGSGNVMLAKDKATAKAFINKAFGRGFSQYQPLNSLKERYTKFRKGKVSIIEVAKGLARFAVPPPYAKQAGREKGYVYFQEFIEGNDHDIRVIVIGNKAYAIKRMVRKNDFRASGSGNILYDKALFDEKVIALSFNINQRLQTQCLALDFVFKNGEPLVVEISFGFSMAGYDPCPGYWDDNLQWHQGKFNPYGWMIEDIINASTKK